MGTFSSEKSANKHSGKFETLIALQNDPRWLLLHSWFSKFPGGGGGGERGPRTTLQERIHGKILDLIILSNLCANHPTIIILMQNTLLFARHLPMIICDFVIRLVLFVACEQNYLSRPLFLLCKGKVSSVFFFFFFLLEAVIFIVKQSFYWLVINGLKFYWLLICWTPHPDPLILY